MTKSRMGVLIIYKCSKSSIYRLRRVVFHLTYAADSGLFDSVLGCNERASRSHGGRAGNAGYIATTGGSNLPPLLPFRDRDCIDAGRGLGRVSAMANRLRRTIHGSWLA